MALILHMVPGSYKTRDDYQNCLYYSDLDFVLSYHDYIVSSNFSERVLIAYYLSAVGNGKEIVDIELRRRMDMDNTA